MSQEKDLLQDTPIINTEKIEKVLSFYKFPLIFGSIGLILIVVAIGLLIKNQSSGNEVIFSTEATLSAKTKIRVDVEGAVVKPGVYEFDFESRISDGLVAAGGLSAGADRDWIAKNLNRAAKLTDGGKIFIPAVGEVTSQRLQVKSDQNNLLGTSIGKVNVNTASQSELEALPGIGPVTAGKIISGRPYQSVEELKEKKIIGNALFEKIKDLITE